MSSASAAASAAISGRDSGPIPMTSVNAAALSASSGAKVCGRRLIPTPARTLPSVDSQRMPAIFRHPDAVDATRSLGHFKRNTPVSPPEAPEPFARVPAMRRTASPMRRGRAVALADSRPITIVMSREDPSSASQARPAIRPRPELCLSARMTEPSSSPAASSRRASSMVESSSAYRSMRRVLSFISGFMYTFRPRLWARSRMPVRRRRQVL